MKKIIPALLLSAWGFMPNNSVATSSLTYTIHTERSTQDDQLNGDNIWIKDLRYPIFSGNEKSIVINQSILSIIRKFSCEKQGDSQIDVETTFLNEHFLSLKYTAAWQCDGMPNPNSFTDAVTYDLSRITKIELNTLFNPETFSEYETLIKASLNQIILEEYEEQVCTADKITYFYLTNTGLITGLSKAADDLLYACEAETRLNTETLKNYWNNHYVYPWHQ